MASPSSLTLSIFFFISLATSEDYLKLPLLHKNPLPSPSQLLSSDTHRLTTPLTSGAPSGSGQYFATLRLGSPPQSLLLIADTGSDLVWAKCSPSHHNHNHNHNHSSFLPRLSSSFSPHHCYHPSCHLIPNPNPKSPHCNHSLLHTPCRYHYSYSDGSSTTGFFSKDTTTLTTTSRQDMMIPDFDFGCAFQISGPSVSGASFNGAQGVLGLGRGPISFVSQLGRRFGNRFSYCLLDFTISPPPTSFLTIGNTNVTTTRSYYRMRYTPLVTNPLSPSFYYVPIRGVAVNGVELRISPSVWDIDEFGNGGTVIDSGTTLSFLAEPAYREVLSAFRREVKLPVVAAVEEGKVGFDLCVNVSGVRVSRLSLLPRLSFLLEGKTKKKKKKKKKKVVTMSPPARNYFIEVAEGVMCLAIQPVKVGLSSSGGFSVIGNLMQQGFLFDFDNDRSVLGFSRHGCASSPPP